MGGIETDVERYQCCFCGDTVKPQKPDVISILVTSNWTLDTGEQANQQLFCHSACLQRKLHPSVPFLSEDLGSERMPEQERRP